VGKSESNHGGTNGANKVLYIKEKGKLSDETEKDCLPEIS